MAEADAGSGRGPVRVVICSDERHIVRLIEANLARQGFQASVASSGDEALVLIRKELPDLLVLDLDMPDRSAYALLTIMGIDSNLHGIAIILLASHDEERFDDNLLPPGSPLIKQVLRKPINPLDLSRMFADLE